MLKQKMNICIPTCNRAEMAQRIGLKAKFFVNNCDVAPYLKTNLDIEILPIHGDPVQCSNEVFRHIVLNAPDDDLLIIEDDVEPCRDFEYFLNVRKWAVEDVEIYKYTINPLYTPDRKTRYTPEVEQTLRLEVKDLRLATINMAENRFIYPKVTMIRQNWVDTNLFIPKALLPEFKEWFKDPVPIRKKSNGIGYHISQKMYQNNYPMFTCVPSLLGHGDHESIIYPEGRKRVPLIATI